MSLGDGKPITFADLGKIAAEIEERTRAPACSVCPGSHRWTPACSVHRLEWCHCEYHEGRMPDARGRYPQRTGTVTGADGIVRCIDCGRPPCVDHAWHARTETKPLPVPPGKEGVSDIDRALDAVFVRA